MTPVNRLIGFILITALSGTAALFVTKRKLLTVEDPREAGLQWLKNEYRLDDATFAKVRGLHESYFSKCENMCKQINAVDRPLLSRMRPASAPPTAEDSAWEKEQAVCTECERNAEEHLRHVAALMPAEQAQRFLDDILPAVRQQRKEHDRGLAPVTGN
ncbi:MAG: hypothetical protein JNJ83_15245 [Verrucomicrobiaceae bacterium]|nr:hypothetical protein [Verrucomicrobiaceae bacterium]